MNCILRITPLFPAYIILYAESEKIVQLALDELLSKKGDMTVVIIAHRLQTVLVLNANFIAVKR